MAEFVSRWLASPSSDDHGGDKGDKSPSGTSGTRTDTPKTQEKPSATPEGSSPKISANHTPPPGCIASRHACPVLGPCDRHLAGAPCFVPYVAQEQTAA